ncbi:hypothetical protein [Clostridium tertium]|uniref:hypothetical protein n=1 Tax=Clostridium tertium TaxID=1559 RepID=UPI0024B35F33|nr:hypothetical protein [Clostridium tertium]MDI9218579.1 hypothetical protein [Clostridium tertium]
MSKKVDKGFKIFYWQLSYRRRFIRILWSIPIFIISIGVIIFLSKELFMSIVIPIILLILFACELIYNYKKWRKEEYYDNKN